MANLIQPSKLDWDLVDEELDRVPDEFKDPRFDSLRHVLDILSAVDAEAALEELKSQQERVEQLVDDVVQGYHSGFNKAIHNYSQILHLFSVSKDQVNKLNSQLQDAQRRLVTHSHSLEAQWKRSVTLGETVSLLKEIEGIVDVPQRVESLQDKKEYKAAVALLLDGCKKLARTEFSGIGALKEIKREVAVKRGSLVKALVEEIESAIYKEVSSSRRLDNEPQNIYGSLRSVDGLHLSAGQPVSPVTPASTGEEGSRTPSRHSLDRRKSVSNPGSSFRLQLEKGNVKVGNAAVEERCKELIACMAQMGGISELQAAVHRHLPDQLKSVISREIESWGRKRHSKPQAIQEEALAKAYAIDPATADAAARLLETVYDTCLQVIQNLLPVLRLIGAAKNPPPSSGLDLLLASRPPSDSQSVGGSAAPASGTAYIRREADFAWECLQKEVQALISKLVQPDNSPGNLTAFQSGLPGAEGSKLSFSFDVQLQGVAARSLLLREKSLGVWEGPDLASLLQGALWGFQGSPYLTPHIYHPTKQFADEAALVLAAMDKETEGGGGAWFGGIDRGEQRAALRTFLSNFVENAFMPIVFMDFKTRSNEVLEDVESMRARAKPQATYMHEAAKGRALLPVVRVVEAFTEELLRWAVLMPAFATRLIGVLENVLGKVLEAFHARVNLLLGSAACKSLSEDGNLAIQMAAEPAAPQAGEAAAFFVGRNADSVDQFVASILQSGFGSGGEAAEVAILQRLLQERPVESTSLLTATDTSRVMNLAAAADSLEYLADVIQGFVMEHTDCQSHTQGERSITPKARRGSELGPSHPSSKGTTGETDGLDNLVDRYRSLAGQSLRALRLDTMLLMVHHLGALPKGRYVCKAAEAQDIEECIGALQRSCSRTDEAIAPFLPPQKRAYIFSGMAAAAAHFVMWLLPEIRELNQAGLARMCRMLAVLQPFLASLGSAGGLFRPEAARHLERARAYYAHLTYSPPALIAAAAARPGRFSAKEYMALLEVDFAGRTVRDTDRAEMAKVVLAAAKRSSKAASTGKI